MRDPYKGISEDCRTQARDRSYENLRLKIASDIVTLMVEHGMTHHDMAEALNMSPTKLKKLLWDVDFSMSDLNNMLDIFSYELVPIFRRRWPVTHN